jgi:hypothetical protein
MRFGKLIFPLFFLCTTSNLVAQSATTIKASVDKQKILIGEPLLLTIEMQFPGNEAIRFVDIDSIGHFEFLAPPRIDTTVSENGNSLKGIYKITSFDSGHWIIPSFIFSGQIKSDTIPVDVVFSDFNPEQNYHDIKDIIEVVPVKRKDWWWYVAGGAGLLLLIVYYLLRKKKPIVNYSKPVVQIDPYEAAKKGLMELEKNNFDSKEYHSKLVDIFRLYLFRKKGILSLQKTSDDLILQIKDLNLNTDLYNQLAQSFRLIDFVKFAKYFPSEEDNRFAFDTIKKSIDEIERSN